MTANSIQKRENMVNPIFEKVLFFTPQKLKTLQAVLQKVAPAQQRMLAAHTPNPTHIFLNY